MLQKIQEVGKALWEMPWSEEKNINIQGFLLPVVAEEFFPFNKRNTPPQIARKYVEYRSFPQTQTFAHR